MAWPNTVINLLRDILDEQKEINANIVKLQVTEDKILKALQSGGTGSNPAVSFTATVIKN